MNRTVIFLVFVVTGIIFTAVFAVVGIIFDKGDIKENNTSPKENSKIEFPEQISLEFTALQPQLLKRLEQIPATWEAITDHLQEFFIGDGIHVSFFIETSGLAPSVVHGVIDDGQNRYQVSDLGYAHDIASISCYPLDLVFSGNDSQIYLTAALGAPAIGYQYLIYDIRHKGWFCFHNWGTPKIVDLNRDGVPEVLFFFSGSGLNLSDIHVLRFAENQFWETGLNNTVCKDMEHDFSSAPIYSTYEMVNDQVIVRMQFAHSGDIAHYFLNDFQLEKITID